MTSIMAWLPDTLESEIVTSWSSVRPTVVSPEKAWTMNTHQRETTYSQTRNRPSYEFTHCPVYTRAQVRRDERTTSLKVSKGLKSKGCTDVLE